MFYFVAGSVGGATNKNERKFLGFAPYEFVERGRGASVIHQNPADFVRNTFELRPIHITKIENRNWSQFRFLAVKLYPLREPFSRRTDPPHRQPP